MIRYVFILIISLFYTGSVWGNFSISTHEKATDEVFNDLTTKAFIASSQDDYPVQLGAFKSKSNADALVNDVKAHLENEVTIVFEDGFYKVRIKGLPRLKAEADSIVTPYQDQYVMKATDSVKKSETVQESVVQPENLPPVTAASYTPTTMDKTKTTVSKIFFLNGDSPWLGKINYFGKSLAFVNALIATIIFSIASMVILLIIILLNKRRLEREEILHQYLLEKYQSLIIDYLFGNASPDEFREIASNTYRRQVLIDQMIDVSVNLKGDEGQKLIRLYKHLNLDKDSIARAYDHRWHKKIKGFRELAFMNIKDANDAIYKALNSSNQILRMEAQIAMVRLSDREPFEFLSHLKSPFSLWEQITLHELILQHNIPLPSFQKWLTSPNSTVVMFALRMIREFKQMEAEDSIRETLLHTRSAGQTACRTGRGGSQHAVDI